MSVILVPRTIGPVDIDCVIHENHDSAVTITDHPIEDGSSINDHAYIEPNRVSLEIANQSASDKYIELVALKDVREKFDLVTGLAVYPDMMIESIQAKRDRETSQILSAIVYLKQVIIIGAQARDISFSQFELPPTAGPGSIDPIVFDQVSPQTEVGDSLTNLVPSPQASMILNSVF